MFVYVLALQAEDGNLFEHMLRLRTHHAVPSVHGRVVLQDRDETWQSH